MGSVLKLSDSTVLPLVYITSEGCESVFIFFQKAIANSDIVHISVIYSEKNEAFLLLYRNFEAFLMNIKDVGSPLFERFFINLKICVEIDKELAILIKYLSLERENISDAKIAKALTKDYSIKNFDGYFQMGIEGLQFDISLVYLKNSLIKMLTNELNLNELSRQLHVENKYEIYRSIVAESFQKTKLYNSENEKLENISALYQVLLAEEKTAIKGIYSLICDISKQCGVPNSNILNLYALESLIVIKPQKFDDIMNIQGLNKKYIHNAVIRKIAGHLMKIKNHLNRDYILESIAEVILLDASINCGIEKNFIATKHEIIAFLNKNFNVNFLKGWKKSIFGEQIVNVLENRSFLEVKNNKLYIEMYEQKIV